MAETATTDITPWLNKAHPTRPTGADRATLAKVMGGRVEARVLYHKSKDTKRRYSEKIGSLATVRSADRPLSPRADALSNPTRSAFSTALRSDNVNNSLNSGDDGGAGLLKASKNSEGFSGSDHDRQPASFERSQSLHTQQSPRIEPGFQSLEPFIETSRGPLNFRNVLRNASDTQIMQTMGSSEKRRALSRKMRLLSRQPKVQTRLVSPGTANLQQEAYTRRMRAQQSAAMETRDSGSVMYEISESVTSDYHSENMASQVKNHLEDDVRNEEQIIVERHNKSLRVGASIKYTISEDDTVDGRKRLQNGLLALQRQSATTFVLPKDWKPENPKASKGIRAWLPVE